MNETIKSIVGLLEEGKPELQVAAAQILGELKPKDAAATQALSAGLDRSPVLGRFCLDALAKIGNASALGALAEAVVEHEVLSEHAAQLLGEIGTPAHGVLAKIYPQAIGEQRIRILTVLSRETSKDSLKVFVTALLTPELTQSAADLLQSAADEFDAASKKQLREGLSKELDESLPPNCIVEILGVLASIDPAGSKALLMKMTEAELPAVVRAAAFRGLRGTKLTGNQVKSMMALLEDNEQKHVHDAVRGVLENLPALPDGMAPSLKRLLASRQPEQRLFAVRMLRTSGGTELAKSFLKLLDHDDERFREAAGEALAHNKQAVEPLLKLLQTTKNPDLARRCAKILGRLGEFLTPKLLKATAEKATKLLNTKPAARRPHARPRDRLGWAEDRAVPRRQGRASAARPQGIDGAARARQGRRERARR